MVDEEPIDDKNSCFGGHSSRIRLLKIDKEVFLNAQQKCKETKEL